MFSFFYYSPRINTSAPYTSAALDIMIDYHLHTKLCKHACGEIFEYIESAISKGLKEIAFTDHIPLPDNFDIHHRMAFSEFEDYVESVNKTKQRYPEISIRLGIEADYYEGIEDYTYNFLKNYDFDLVIMSIHFINHWPDGNWVFDYNIPGKNYSEIYTDYISSLTKGIQTGLFDVIGHADIIKKPGHSLITFFPGLIENMLWEAKKRRMAIELNTSGYRKAANESYPGFDWLSTIKKLDLPVTIGSDAHKPSQVALKFDKVIKALNTYKINKLALFEKRKLKISDLNLL